MRPSLGRVLAASNAGSAHEHWVDALGLISSERDAIESVLADNPPPHIYGFTTLLGQLDALPTERVDQGALLEAHLVGTTRDAPAAFLALVTRCKLEQLHHGGSGIHPDTYRALLSSTADSARGAWLSSYGSGDVVPAAWWIQTTLSADVRAELRQGDLIGLLNGNFYSTSLSIAAAIATANCLAAFLRRAARQCSYPPSSATRGGALLSPALGEYFVAHHTSSEGRAQLPISLRDADAYLAPITVAVAAVGEALERRLTISSANPLFSVANGAVTVESQSGFLDVTLTLALTNLAQVLHLVTRATQRLIVHASATAAEQPDSRRVQPPKAAMAVVERATLVAGQLPTQFTGSDSDGIEDLRDLSLLTASSVLELVALATEAIEILDTVTTAPSDDDEPLDALMELLSGDPQLDARKLVENFSTLREPFLR